MLIDEMQWVLRNARMHARDHTLRSAAGFAQGAGIAEPVHRSQVGRWENGRVEVTRGLVRRYETVLALPEGQLLAAIDFFSRARNPLRSTATLSPREEPDVDETLALLERALAEDRMSGLDWDRLSDNLGRMPHAMIRARDWEALLRRGLEELSLSLHLDYAQRSDALARLAGHPRSGAIVAGMAEEVLGQPEAQFYNDTLTLLSFTTHPQAIAVLLGQLHDPTNTSARRACLLVLTTLGRAGRLDRETKSEAAMLAVRHLRDSSQPYRVHRGAANLVRELGPTGSQRLANALTSEDRRTAALIIRDGRAISSQAIREAHRRIRAALDVGDGRGSASEPVLNELIETALGDTNEEDRSNALGIIMISPQSRVIGRVHAQAFAHAYARGDHVAVHESLTVLTWMGQPGDLDLFERVALSPVAPSDVVMEAGYVVGNTVEAATRRRDDREAAFARRIAEVIATARGEAAADELRGLTYVLGMRGRYDLIGSLIESLPPQGVDRSSTTEVARRVLSWWLDIPPHLRPVR